jgi:hypothetical protein
MKRFIFAAAAAAFTSWASAAIPIIVGQDFMAAPTNQYMADGTTLNGEGGHGGILTVFGTNFPAFSNWGPSGTAHLYLTNLTNGTQCEVYAYDSLATPPWDDGTIPKQPSIQGIRVQVGNLTDLTACGAAYGTAMAIDVVVGTHHATNNRTTVNGSGYTTYYSLIVGADAPNKRTGLVGDYEPLLFTPINGQVLFVNPDPLVGSDSNYGDFNHPFLHLQGSDGYSGALRNCHSGQTDGTKPATQVVLRGGPSYTYTPIGSWNTPAPYGTGNAGRWANFIRISGVAPGPNQWQGPVEVTSYAGPAGSNANEIAILDQSAGTVNDYAGGFIGADSARAQEQNGWDHTLTGWNKFVNFSWLKVIANPHGPNDGAPYNIDYSADDMRLVAVEGVWQATTNNSDGFRCAGWCGDGMRVRTFLNSFHDISGCTNCTQPNTNHGIYPDSGVIASNDVTIAFTAIKNITGGSSISINHSGSDSDHIQNLFVYNNWMSGANKSNLVVNYVQSTFVWNNVMEKAGETAVNIANGIDFGTNGFQVFNNDIIDWDQLAGGRAAFWDQGGDGSTWDARNNIIMRTSSSTGTGPWYVVNFNTYLFTNDFWYDATGNIVQTIPDNTNGGKNVNPKFVGASTDNFTLGTTSTAADYAASLIGTVPRDFDFMLKPANGVWDDGAYERQ